MSNHTLQAPDARQVEVTGCGLKYSYLLKSGVKKETVVTIHDDWRLVFVSNVKDESIKTQIQDFARADFEQYLSALRSGEKHIEVIRVGCDFQYNALSGEREDFDFRELLINQILHCEKKIVESHVVSDDVTTEVLALYDSRSTVKVEKSDTSHTCWECGRTFTDQEALNLVRSGDASFDGPTEFYCGC